MLLHVVMRAHIELLASRAPRGPGPAPASLRTDHAYVSGRLGKLFSESEHGTFHVRRNVSMGHFMFSGRYLRTYA
eukprot:COSAG05_NODE_3740_length_1868_cov_2.084794_2_plen_75_part_00